MKKVIFFFCAALILQTATAQTTLAGVNVSSTLKVADKTLTLNGAGIRKKLFIEVYVGALYVTNVSKDGVALAKADEPMAMRITITSGLVTSEKMAEATKEGFEKSTGGNTAAIKTRIDKFIDVFKREPITKNNVFDLVYIPGTGVTVSKGGKVLETIAGLDFKTALFGIWLGANPVDEGLKAGLTDKAK